MIVVSILLAFAIDAGWDELLERREEVEVLRALAEEFGANRAEAASTIDAHERSAVLVVGVSLLTASEVRTLPPDSVALIIASMASPRTFDPVRGTLDALIGSGRLELVGDEALRRALVVFLNFVDDSQEDARYLAESARRVWDRRVALGGPWQGPAPDLTEGACEAPVRPSACYLDATPSALIPAPTVEDLERLLADREYVGQVRQMQINARRYLAEIRRILAQVDLVIDLIDTSLE